MPARHKSDLAATIRNGLQTLRAVTPHCFLLGLKLSYSMMDDFSSRDGYSQHVVPGMTGFTEISGTNHWSLMLNVKYLFSD